MSSPHLSPADRVIQFKLTHSYNPAYFTQNELQSLTPLPLAWDRTSLSGSRGSGSTLPAGTGNGLDMTTAGAKAVYNFLIAQNKDLSTYASNWLWQITSGPFKLKTYAVNGASTMVPNPYYGGVKPKISVLSYVPFTSASSEFLALASGSSGIDVGYTSYADIARQSLLANYQLEPWPSWAVTTLYLNFNNPKVGAIFNQQYIRVALQSLIDEPLIVKDVYHGYASVTMGPVPLTPASAYLTSYLSSFPYPYDPSKAISLLTSHGWAVHPQGTTTCQRPGSASNECGAGIASGSALNFTLTYSSAEPETQVMHIQEKTNFSAAGVVLNLHPVIPATLFASVGACTSSQPLCSWQIGEFQDKRAVPEPDSGCVVPDGLPLQLWELQQLATRPVHRGGGALLGLEPAQLGAGQRREPRDERRLLPVRAEHAVSAVRDSEEPEGRDAAKSGIRDHPGDVVLRQVVELVAALRRVLVDLCGCPSSRRPP